MVSDELALTGIDVTAHVMENHREALAQHRVTYAEDLQRLRSGMVVRVAGIRVATQTPPMASGRRVVFISLDDGTGCADVAFFEEAQEHAGEILFTAQLMLVEGTVRRTGPRAVSIQALRAWDLRADGPQKEVRVPSPDWGRDTDLSRISSG
ncbi:OB-fold nucleic acid binding domain-containing protein [Nesterenkonia aerolata]|uniref:Error-prone DNA polymerase n=1 Tax=Nesterenkonia aerolata TaxID=3074079 RepID=A0ABU2DS29_9MICC|nr:OB-fold nucleic acid binding domain-containing protein [Nesterenkonia sp. LY-0111]MDR8019181.1 OB-fold nucleic acid binding domain-containing protein [Nesterenkonia sp. LY-0111]